MCPTHRDGSFSCPSTMEKLNVFSQYYVEGDAWHYRFNAEHDIPGLISLFGGNKSFVSALEEFHSRSFLDPTEILPNPYYWAGNEARFVFINFPLFSTDGLSLIGRPSHALSVQLGWPARFDTKLRP